MKRYFAVPQLPQIPAWYALCGGRSPRSYVVYIGIADRLRSRISQHLVQRDSSIVTGVSPARLNPDYVAEVKWWEHPRFTERTFLAAAELVAFEMLDPVLRSRGSVEKEASQLAKDEYFRRDIRTLVENGPAGLLSIHTLQDALDKIAELEQRLAELEARIGQLGGNCSS